ncbi:MAG TPA: hypothetical protein DCZ94_00270 [Lentisphaeria bacterium]|nr:MAG: hypothetical protein A2X48_18765 [Lentisphaerae bacterium GWF2_49_21]HBC85367.1 hypothetical protein [Lentisphaeria bacterium]
MFKRKYIHIASWLLALTLVFCFAGRLLAQEKVDLETERKNDMAKAKAVKDEAELESETLSAQARKAFEKDDFEAARDLYLKAREIMKKNLGAGDYNNARIQAINEALAAVYQYWAEDLAAKAEKAVSASQYDEAIKHCMDAIEVSPSCKDRMENLIERFNTMKEAVKFRSDTSEKNIDPKKESREYNIDVLFEQGKKFYDDDQYDKARDKFEEILVINPYHMRAIQYIKNINAALYRDGDRRYKLTRRERLTEAEWKYVPPIIPRTLSGNKEVMGKEPMLKDEGTSSIQKKLSDIIIDHIEFEDVSIPTVVKYLKTRSRELDPEKQGVNILLRLNTGENAAAPAPAADGAAAPADGGAAPAPAPAAADVPTITMLVDDIPLGDAIRYICRGANLKYRIERYAVVIAAQDIPLDELETRIYPVEKDAFTELGGGVPAAGGAAAGDAAGGDPMEAYFRTRGISFPEGAKMVFDSRISRLIATNTPDNLTKIEEIIHELNVVDPQVLIETKFVEISQINLDSLGVEWLVRKTAADLGTDISKSKMTFGQNDPINRYGAATVTNTEDTLFHITRHTSQGITYQALVHALNKSSTADVLATPRVTTQNGQEATIRMVTEEYFPTSWTEATMTQTGINSVFSPSVPELSEPTELGVRLTVTPTVDADRYTISLDMTPIVQSFIGWTDYSYIMDNTVVPPLWNVIRMPIFEVRTIETKLVVYDGETVVMGGSIKDTSGFTDDRIPILGDLPLVGALFRSQAQNREKRNLLIFVTVRLVNPDGSPLREREIRGLPPFRR